MLGVMSARAALEMAVAADLDLVKISPNGIPCTVTAMMIPEMIPAMTAGMAGNLMLMHAIITMIGIKLTGEMRNALSSPSSSGAIFYATPEASPSP